MSKGSLLVAACALVALTLITGGAPVLPVVSGIALGAAAVWVAGFRKTGHPR